MIYLKYNEKIKINNMDKIIKEVDMAEYDDKKKEISFYLNKKIVSTQRTNLDFLGHENSITKHCVDIQLCCRNDGIYQSIEDYLCFDKDKKVTHILYKFREIKYLHINTIGWYILDKNN